MGRRRALTTVMGAMLCIAGSAAAQTCPTPTDVTQACSGNACAKLTVGAASGASGAVSISFTQGANDNQAQRGSDDVAALAFTLGLPGTGSDVPLAFDCSSGNLAANAVVPSAAIADDFAVVVENAQCNNRTHCLCPDTGAGQQADNYVNIAVYGPKALPESGPVTIPKLPADGAILTLNLKATASATPNVAIPLHIFSGLDGNKPQFAANVSIGDQSACDVTATGGVSNILLTDGSFTPGTVACTGDCNHDGTVAINELIIGVNIALGSQPVSACPSFDVNSDGSVAINELISAVNHALSGC